MKILILFVDMLRPNRFGTYNDKIQDNPIDAVIRNLGGTLYTNCFSPAPDTPRSIACFYSGLLPGENGCDSRVKWPGKFMKKDIQTIFDPFIKNNYKMDFFCNPNERQGGLLPPGIEKIGNHNKDLNLLQFIREISLAEDHMIFISIPDFHWAMQDWGYTQRGEKAALFETRQSLDIIFDHLDKDDFDHIFLFSDHGFKFSAQLEFESTHDFINRDRTNVFMLSRAKGEKSLSYEHKLCSIQDLSHTVNHIFGVECKYSLFSDGARDYVLIEDHCNISPPKVNLDLDIWALINDQGVYVRTLTAGVFISHDQAMQTLVIDEYDAILQRETQFGRYYDEQQKVFAYHELVLAQTDHLNGNPRADQRAHQNILRWIEKLKDNLCHRVGGSF